MGTQIVIRVDPSTRAFWKEKLTSLLPDATIYLWDEDTFNPDEIDFAVVWAPPSGMLASMPNLRAVFSVGAGISHITDHADHPPQLPIVRTTGPVLRQRMCEYIALHVLRIHRRLPEIEAASSAGTWNWIVEPTADQKTVGIMGVGNLGLAAAACLTNLGYKVKGLARQPRESDGFPVYTPDQIGDFMADLDIVVSMLPGTPDTENIIRASTIELLPEGAWVINVGRGSQVQDDDLVAALDAGHLGGAVLDVFRTEPLPEDHQFWTHPKILVTSHTASAIEADVGGVIVAENIQRFITGEPIADLVDLEQGY